MSVTPKKTRCFIFDLDGTLCNTLDDLGNGVNKILGEEGLPTHPIDAYKYFVGNGMKMLITRSLPEDKRTDEYIEKVLARFLDHYEKHYLDETRPYDGITEAVSSLKQKGMKLAVVTNKTHERAEEIVRRFFGDSFDLIIGNTSRFPLKPAPDATIDIMRQLGATVEDTVFVGDSSVDMQTAKNANLFAVGVLWGFRTAEELKAAGADILISDPKELTEII